MKTLDTDELYHNVHGFLKMKGIELKPGSYSQKIQKGCALLSDAINVGQEGLTRAKVEIDKKLGQLRQIIHEKTAPAGQSTAPPTSAPKAPKRSTSAHRSRKKTRRSKKTGAA